MAGGLQPSSNLEPMVNLGVQIFEHADYGGDAWTFAPEEYVDDLTEFDEGLGLFGGDWNDKISSIQLGRCYCEVWEDTSQRGASLILYQDTPNLGAIGWNDRISTIWCPYQS